MGEGGAERTTTDGAADPTADGAAARTAGGEESTATVAGPLQRLFGPEATVARDRAFQVLLLGSVISPMGSSVVSPVLEALAGPYGVSVARVGLLMSAFTAPSIVAIPLVGALSDRVGRRPVLVAGLTLFGLAGGAAALTTDFRVVVGLRLLQGLGYTGIGPVLITSVGDLYAGEREATAQGLRFATVGLSLAAFPVLAGFLVTRDPRFPFALFALALPVAVVVLLRLDEPTDRASPDSGGDDGGGEDGGAADDDGGGDTLLVRLRDPLVVATLVGRALPSFLWFAFLTYASVLTGRVLGAPPGIAGLTVGLASLGSAVGGTQVGRLTGAFDSRRVPLAATMAVSGAGLALFALAPSVPVAMAGAALVGSGFGTVLTLYRSTVTGLAGARARGGAGQRRRVRRAGRVDRRAGRAGARRRRCDAGARLRGRPPVHAARNRARRDRGGCRARRRRRPCPHGRRGTTGGRGRGRGVGWRTAHRLQALVLSPEAGGNMEYYRAISDLTRESSCPNRASGYRRPWAAVGRRAAGVAGFPESQGPRRSR